MTIILGIDPGSLITGYGVISNKGSDNCYLASGCIRVMANTSTAERLQHIFAGLRAVIAQYQPIEAAIEQIFMHINPGSALKLGQARGVAMLAAALQTSKVAEYSARQIKQAVVGYGAASKGQVQQMVKMLLKLSGTPQADAADALAVALCHSHSRQGIGRMLNTYRNKRGSNR